MDRVQTFLMHDKVVEKLESITDEYGYTPPQIFNIGIQIVNYFLSMKDDGWECGIWKVQDGNQGMILRKLTFPHEEDFEDGNAAVFEEPHENVEDFEEYVEVKYDEPDYEENEGEDYDEEDEDGWLDIKWKK